MTSRNFSKIKLVLKLSVVIPSFKGADVLSNNVPGLIAYFKQKNLSFEIIIVDDGLLDMTIVAPATKAAALASAFHLFQTASSGNAADRDDIGYLRAKQFKITTNPPQKIAIDGEVIEAAPVEIKCIPGALNIFVPTIEEVEPLEKLEGLPNLVIEEK